MKSADPVSNPDDLPATDVMTEGELERARRPVEADWGPEVERAYYNAGTGEPTPERQSVSPEQAGKDLANVREQERQAREAQANADLASALDQTGRTGQQQPAQQDQQRHALDGFSPSIRGPRKPPLVPSPMPPGLKPTRSSSACAQEPSARAH